MEATEKICKYCGKPFLAKDPRRIFCCSACCTKWHNENNKPKKEPKKCIICGKEFIPWNKTQVTCGCKECVKAYSLIQKKKKRGAYKYAKNGGLTITHPPKRKKHKAWDKCTPEERWERMSWQELTAELARLHIKYGQGQVLKQQGKLPDDFGLRCR